MDSRWRMWVGILAVFLCGLAVGVVGGDFYARYRTAQHIARIGKGGEDFLARMAMDRLRDELELSPEQVARIRPLLADAYRRGHEQFMAVRPKLDAIMKQTLELIRKELSEKQKAMLDRGQGIRLLLPPPPPGGPPPEGPPPGPPPGCPPPGGPPPGGQPPAKAPPTG